MTYAEPYSSTRRQWEINLRRAGTTPPPWKPPALRREGRPFEPSGVEPGAFVEIRFLDVRATAQVWSASPRGVWAVLADEARAVEVCTRSKHTPHLCGDLAHVTEGGAS